MAAAKQGHKFYKSAAEAARSLRAAGDSNSTTWWGQILKTVVGTSSAPSVLSNVAPIVGGLVGFISSFIGSESDPAPREPLNFEGSLKMSGTITLSHPLYAMDLGLKYTIGGNPPDYYRALNDITWGIFNLNTRPNVYINKGKVCSNRVCRIYTEAYLADMPSHVFNFSAGLQLVSINYAFTFLHQAPTLFSSDPYHYTEKGTVPAGLAVQVKMRTTIPTHHFDDDLVFYKVYPFTTVYSNTATLTSGDVLD